MSDKLETVKAEFDAMIAQMKEDVYRQVDLEMEMLLEMWREEKRRKNTRARAVKRMGKDKAAEDGGGHQSDDNEDNEDSVSVKSEIESDECHCDSDEEDYSNVEVKEELPDEDAAAPVASTSRGRKRQAMPTRNVATKKQRITPPVDSERQESASGSGNFKMKVLSIDCIVAKCQSTFRCGHKMREHLLAVHKMKPFQCHVQGCEEQFDKRGEFCHHTRTHPRATTTWICPNCPSKTFSSSSKISTHITHFHQTGQFQCAVDQCQFTSTTRSKVHGHQHRAHRPSQHTCSSDGCTRSFKMKSDLTRHQRTHTLTTPFHCTFVDCGYKGNQRCVVVRHIRTVHFHLPPSLKEQHRRGIVDNRDPNEFIQVDEEQLAPRQP